MVRSDKLSDCPWDIRVFNEYSNYDLCNFVLKLKSPLGSFFSDVVLPLACFVLPQLSKRGQSMYKVAKF
jgi:hypothetical protein